MSPKSKAKRSKGAAKDVTLKRKAKRQAHKSQPLPTYSPTYGEEMSEHTRTETHSVEAENSLDMVMDMLEDISGTLSAREHFVEKVRAYKVTEAAHRDQSPPLTWTTPGTKWGYPTGGKFQPQQAAPTAVCDMSDAVMAKVASHMRWASVMDVITSDKDSDVGEEPTPAPRKIRTANSSLLYKVVWPHEVMYTAAGKLVEYE